MTAVKRVSIVGEGGEGGGDQPFSLSHSKSRAFGGAYMIRSKGQLIEVSSKVHELYLSLLVENVGF